MRRLPTIQIDVKPHPGQTEVHNHPARFKVLAAGRRWGKTRLGVNECLQVAAHGGRAWWIAPNYKMSEVGWRPLRRIGAKIGAEIRKVDRQIILPNGGWVCVRSADNPDSLRGEGLDFVIFDENAFIAEAAWIEAVSPALADRQGKAVFISTPKRRNWFYRLYQQGLDNDNIWQSWQIPTKGCEIINGELIRKPHPFENPHIEWKEVVEAFHNLPMDIFRQEWMAAFLEGEGIVFRNITACLHAPDPADMAKHKGHQIVAGVDWAKQNDFTAISVGCRTCQVEIARDRFNKIDYAFQVKRLEEIIRRYDVQRILVELNSIGEPNFESLQRMGLPVIGFQTTAKSKPPLIENLALALQAEEWQFQNDKVWTGELEAYEVKINDVTNRATYSAPEGMHDDTVVARALMLRAAGSEYWYFS